MLDLALKIKSVTILYIHNHKGLSYINTKTGKVLYNLNEQKIIIICLNIN